MPGPSLAEWLFPQSNSKVEEEAKKNRDAVVPAIETVVGGFLAGPKPARAAINKALDDMGVPDTTTLNPAEHGLAGKVNKDTHLLELTQKDRYPVEDAGRVAAVNQSVRADDAKMKALGDYLGGPAPIEEKAGNVGNWLINDAVTAASALGGHMTMGPREVGQRMAEADRNTSAKAVADRSESYARMVRMENFKLDPRDVDSAAKAAAAIQADQGTRAPVSHLNESASKQKAQIDMVTGRPIATSPDLAPSAPSSGMTDAQIAANRASHNKSDSAFNSAQADPNPPSFGGSSPDDRQERNDAREAADVAEKAYREDASDNSRADRESR